MDSNLGPYDSNSTRSEGKVVGVSTRGQPSDFCRSMYDVTTPGARLDRVPDLVPRPRLDDDSRS